MERKGRVKRKMSKVQGTDGNNARRRAITTDVLIEESSYTNEDKIVLNHGGKSLELVEITRTHLDYKVWSGMFDRVIPVEVKLMKKNCTDVEEFSMEVELLKKLQHKNIISFIGEARTKQTYLIKEMLYYGNLLHHLPETKDTLALSGKIEIAKQICAGLNYLSQRDIVHRDIRAVNMQLGRKLRCKISNFEMAKTMVDGKYQAPSESKFAVKWTAPESATTGIFSIKSDVWSFAILITELLTHGEIPYYKMMNREVLQMVVKGYRIPKPVTSPDFPDSLYEFMLQCWNINPDQRPTLHYVQSFLEDFFSKTEPNYITMNETRFFFEDHPIKIDEKLTRGAFYETWKGCIDGSKVCVKKPLNKSSVNDVVEEAALLINLDHPNIIKLLWVSAEPEYLVFEFMEEKDLLQFLQKGRGRFFNLRKQLKVAGEIAGGMDFIGKNEIIHRNLRASNILVNENGVCKVAGFRSARKTKKGEFQLKVPDFVNRWMAPEAGLNGTFNVKTDVWSFAVTLSEIFTKGEIPYSELEDQEIVMQTAKEYRMPKPVPPPPQPAISDSIYDLMLQCWHCDPKQRCTFHYLKMFFKNYFEIIDQDYEDFPHKGIYEINTNDLGLQYVLDTGATSDLWKGKFKKAEVAVQVLRDKELSPEEFFSGLNAMRLLVHENIVYLYGIISRPPDYCIVTELTQAQSLLDYLRDKKRRIGFQEKIEIAIQTTGEGLVPYFSMEDAFVFCHDVGCLLHAMGCVYNPKEWRLFIDSSKISKGINFIGKNNVVHCDLRANSISITNDGIYKINNFSLAQTMENGTYLGPTGVKFPIRWSSPEVCLKGLFSIKSDVWSFGVLLTELVNRGSTPYPELTNQEIPARLEAGYRMRKPQCEPSCPDYLYELMLQCWHQDASRRPTFDYIQEYLEDWSCNCELEPRYIDCLDHNWHVMLESACSNVIYEDALFQGEEESTLRDVATQTEIVLSDEVKKEENEETLQTENIEKWLSKMLPFNCQVVKPFVCYGNLLSFMKNNFGKSLTLFDQIRQTVEMCSGLSFLHRNNILHRDIRAENVVVLEGFRYSITTFDSAVAMVDGEYSGEKITKCPVRWKAIEALVEGCFNPKSDVWSFGIFLTEIVTKGRLPYPDLLDWEIVDKVTAGHRMKQPEPFVFSEKCPDALYDLMMQCWEMDPDERPSSDELKEYLTRSFGIFHLPEDDFEVLEEAVITEDLVKDGSYYQLWSGRLNETREVVVDLLNNSREVSVKTSKGNKTTSEEIRDEINIIQDIRHKNIVRYLGQFFRRATLCLVYDEKSCHVLSDYLSNEKPSRDFQLNVAKQISTAMIYLERRGIVLRALRAEGIWLSSSHECRVAEFTYAKRLTDGFYRPEVLREKLPARWIAPEAFVQKQFSAMSDVWSYGVLLMEIITLGCKPYPELAINQVVTKVKSGYRMSYPVTNPPCPEPIYKLMRECWAEDETKRPTFQYIENFIEWNLRKDLLVNFI